MNHGKAGCDARRPGDKIIVKRNTNGPYIYFSARQDDDGSIIDFVQYRQNLSLGGAERA